MSDFDTSIPDDGEEIIMYPDVDIRPAIGDYLPVYDAEGNKLGGVIVATKDDEKMTLLPDPYPDQ
jgi:hypothetical protein